MKLLNYALLVLILFVSLSCDRSDDFEVEKSMLAGKWQLSETMFSIGTEPEWRPVSEESGKSIVEFKKDGRLEGSAFSDYKRYTVKDSVTLTFTKENKEIQNFDFRIKDGTLTMSPAGPGPVCIEGCASRFLKVE